jgi:uncharacterized protein (DUF608 family)
MNSSAIILATCLAFPGYPVASDGLQASPSGHDYNGYYTGDYLSRVAFPIGGIGSGMFCLEGTGSISHLSVRHAPDLHNEPVCFAAISVKGRPDATRVVEARVPGWKIFGRPGTGDGAIGKLYGLPRFDRGSFQARFPFGQIELEDGDVPLKAAITGWSPFIPGDEDHSGLPVGVLEYTFTNTTGIQQEAVFSWNSRNILVPWAGPIQATPGGFIMSEEPGNNEGKGRSGFAVYTPEPAAVVDYCWFRGEWFDPYMMLWKNIETGAMPQNPPRDEPVMGASIYVPFTLRPGEQKTIVLNFCWYMPGSNLSVGNVPGATEKLPPYRAWYTGRFKDLDELIGYWDQNFGDLKRKSERFRDAFYASTLPSEVTEAVAANLTILKSPTILRQEDGRLWAWEGCSDREGNCHGTCTHVWNYAQAIPHLFPGLERTLRETEFLVSQDETGHQNFRANLPISPPSHDFNAAADGQLGGIMKVYRDWRISGDTDWMRSLYPRVKQSLDYCIDAWDPDRKGVPAEPHHNTYDIEFWGPNGMITSFYLGALTAFIEMSRAAGVPCRDYEALLSRGKAFMETRLFNGEYYIQQVVTGGLRSPGPVESARKSYRTTYSEEALELLEQEGPKYQYGTGCLSDGVLGMWLASVCGLPEILDGGQVKSHLESVHRYNLKRDLSDHVNPQRATYAIGEEGGLLLCTWPKGGKLSLPFIYSNEVWTGIEYQVASHLILKGEIEKGLEIVRTTRDRYDGRIRNPFNEYEFGNWYARAMSSYALIQALTGVRYDAVEKTLYIDSKVGDFTSFLSTGTGFGNVSLKDGVPIVHVAHGSIDVRRIIVSGKEIPVK